MQYTISEIMNALLKSLIEADSGCFSLVELVNMLIDSHTTGSACIMKLFKSKLVFVMFETILQIFLLTSAHTLV